MNLRTFVAAVYLTGLTTAAFAANPFVDVPTDSWAYQSVVSLADAGIIQGVDGSYFQGGRAITRYEAAEMTAKAMAHMDKASVEQRALINKLADEYADELNNLGVRVAALENKVGNVKLSGDYIVRYRHQKQNKASLIAGKENDAAWDMRLRLRGTAKVNDRTTAAMEVNSSYISLARNGEASHATGHLANVYGDVAKVDYNFGGNTWNLSVGRIDRYILGHAYGYTYGDMFDRAELTYKTPKLAVTTGYGRFRKNDITHPLHTDHDDLDQARTGYGEIEGFLPHGISLGVYYNDFSGKSELHADHLWGYYAKWDANDKWSLLGNYEKLSRDDNRHPDVWIGKLTYGKASFALPQSWDTWVEYLNADPDADAGFTTSWRWSLLDNIKSWGIGADYTIDKNAQFQVMQSFASKNKEGGGSVEEMTRAQFMFVF